MTRQTRQYHNNEDRIVRGAGATPAEIECRFACAPFDRVAVDMDRTWGVDRLPELVTPEMSARYGKAMAWLHTCMNTADPAATIAAAENCRRGLIAMDAAARAAGHAPLPPVVWEYDLDGEIFVIAQDGADWPLIEAMRPGVTIYTLRQAAIALRESNGMVAAVMDKFPGAVITDIRPPRSKIAEAIDDEIPF